MTAAAQEKEQAMGEQALRCPRCNGRGFFFVHNLYSATRVGCHVCNGTGSVRPGSKTETPAPSTAGGRD